MKKKSLTSILIAFLLLFTFSSNALAEETYPARAVHIITSNPPGGVVDVSIRIVVDRLAKNLGVPIVVENRPGAAGAAGTLFMVTSKPDGYTIGCFASRDNVIIPATIPSVPYKHTDLDPLCKYTESAIALLCKGDAPWKSWEDFVADAKKRPNKITFGVSTNSMSAFLIGGYLRTAGISLITVPLSSGQQAVVRVLGGNLDVVAGSPTTMMGQLTAGNLKMLLLVSPERMDDFPEVATYKEMGYPPPLLGFYTGFYAPVGLPKPVRETLVKALAKTLADPTLKKDLLKQGAYLKYLPSELFAKEIDEDYKRVVNYIKSTGPR